MVDTHSYKLSPFGPALQFVGGSSEISANSFWIRRELLDSELFLSLIVYGVVYRSSCTRSRRSGACDPSQVSRSTPRASPSRLVSSSSSSSSRGASSSDASVSKVQTNERPIFPDLPPLGLSSTCILYRLSRARSRIIMYLNSNAISFC